MNERDLWACASEVQRQHGHGGQRFAAERIIALLVARDAAGAATWRAIAARIGQLERSARSAKQ